jgi:hypothetical protein
MLVTFAKRKLRCPTGPFFLSLALTISMALVIRIAGQGTSELQLVTRAADALGGRDRVMAVKTLQVIGYGELAYFNGGGNITGDPAAPQKWQKVLEYTRTIDLEHSRTRVQQRLKMDFVFASTAGQLGLNRTYETLDGDIAYNIGGGFLAAPQTGAQQPQPAGPQAARQRRVELLAHPLTIVRAALDPTSKLSNLRKQGDVQLVDITVRQGDLLTLAVNGTSNLPCVGQLCRPKRQPRGRHVSNSIRRLRAGKRHSTADRARHHDRLPQRGAKQTLRRSQHRRCVD